MKTLKMMILFMIFVLFSGCSQKYVDAKGGSLRDKIAASWEKLDCEIVEQDERGFSLGLKVKDIIVVGDSLRSGELYKTKSLGEGSGWILLGGMIGFSGSVLGMNYALSNFPEWDEQTDRGCLISFTSCVAGLGVFLVGGTDRREVVKGIPDLIKGDTVCVDGVFLSEEEVKVVVENVSFEEVYYTDDDGNLKLEFNEIISEPTDADSVINLIIRYYELVDTVKVRRL